MGAEVEGLMFALRHHLAEAVAVATRIIALTGDGDKQLRSLRAKIYLFIGELALFAPQ